MGRYWQGSPAFRKLRDGLRSLPWLLVAHEARLPVGLAMNDVRTISQNDLLQAACGDLSTGMTWFGNRLSKDEWRWLISAAILKVKIVPAINTGDGGGGVVTLGGSSKKLSKEKCTEAITLAFAVGDAPWEYDRTNIARVKWGNAVRLARGMPDNEL